MNTFDALANHQFIESRVYEDDDRASNGSVRQLQRSQRAKEEIEASAIRNGISALALFSQPGETPADQYNQRPLPCLIGSHEYYADPGLGISSRVAQFQPNGTVHGANNGNLDPDLDLDVDVDVEGDGGGGMDGAKVEEEGGLFESDEEEPQIVQGVPGGEADVVAAKEPVREAVGEDQTKEPARDHSATQQQARRSELLGNAEFSAVREKPKAFSGLFDSSEESEEETEEVVKAGESSRTDDAVLSRAQLPRVKGTLFSDSESDSEDSGLFPAAEEEEHEKEPEIVEGLPSETLQASSEHDEEQVEAETVVPKHASAEKGEASRKVAFLSELNAALGKSFDPARVAPKVDDDKGNSQSASENVHKNEDLSSSNQVVLSRPTIPARRKRPKGRIKSPRKIPSKSSREHVASTEESTSESTSNVVKASPSIDPATIVPLTGENSGLFDDVQEEKRNEESNDKDAKPEPKVAAKPPKSKGLFDDDSDDDEETDLFSSTRHSTFKASSLAKTSLFGDSDSDSGLFD